MTRIKYSKKSRGRQVKNDSVLAARKFLKDHGLLKTDLRRKVSARDRAALKKFSDLLTGKATLVENIEPKAARRLARSNSNVMRVTKSGQLIVKKMHSSERVTYNKRTGIISTRYKTKDGWRSLSYQNVKNLERLPELKTNQAYAIPFKRGNGVEYITRASREEIMALAFEYENSAKPYKKAARSVIIITLPNVASKIIETPSTKTTKH